MLDEPDGLIFGFGFEEVGDEFAEHTGRVDLIGANVGVQIEVVPDVAV